MACAKPVITANLAGVRSVYENNVSGLSFEVLDKEDLEQKVRKLFLDNELRGKMGLAARDRVEKMYAQDTLIRQLEGMYKEI
jgi:glycosyltransferase involved in cell wall biosynthesis